MTERNPLVFWNAKQADSSVCGVVESGARVYPGHGLPFRMRDREARYLGEERITLLNAGAERPGQTLVPDAPPREQWVMPGIEEQRLPNGPARSR